VPRPGGHLQGVDHELGSDVIGDRSAHDHAAEGVEDHSHIDLALGGGVLGDVDHPQPIGLGGIEAAVDQVFGRMGNQCRCPLDRGKLTTRREVWAV
jgi:hypothetical protein